MTEINSTVTPVTDIGPDILIFTAVAHKEGDTSDNVHEKCFLQNIKPHVVNRGILNKLIS